MNFLPTDLLLLWKINHIHWEGATIVRICIIVRAGANVSYWHTRVRVLGAARVGREPARPPNRPLQTLDL